MTSYSPTTSQSNHFISPMEVRDHHGFHHINFYDYLVGVPSGFPNSLELWVSFPSELPVNDTKLLQMLQRYSLIRLSPA